MKRRLAWLVLGLLASQPALANEEPFGLWVEQFKQEARTQGISAGLLERAFANISLNERVIELDRKQPEGTMTFGDYLKRVVNNQRAKEGRELYQQHKALLHEIGERYGVQPRFIVALWGIETNYGSNTGGFDMIEALTTLAYDGRRSQFFRDELLKALRIVDEGHIPLQDFSGSWAGAMGQTQFMPSSFLNFAVDYNGDGRKDIWNTLPDIFASIANYLKNTGWNPEETWGREVRTPANLDPMLATLDTKKSLAEWQALGVRRLNGKPLPQRPDVMGSVIFPGEGEDRAYLVYGNFDRIMKWNRSKYFATSVGTLADMIAGRG